MYTKSTLIEMINIQNSNYSSRANCELLRSLKFNDLGISGRRCRFHVSEARSTHIVLSVGDLYSSLGTTVGGVTRTIPFPAYPCFIPVLWSMVDSSRVGS